MRTVAPLALVCIAATAGPAGADISVIVSKDSEVRQLSPAEVSNLYLGRGRTSGKFPRFLILERPRDSDVRRRFFKRLTGMDLQQVDTTWARLQFSGEAFPPTPLREDAQVIEALRFYPDAIGYVDSGSLDTSVREILRIKE